MFPLLLAPYFLASFFIHTLNPWLLPCVTHVTEHSCSSDWRCQPFTKWSATQDDLGMPLKTSQFLFCNAFEVSKQAEKYAFAKRCLDSGGEMVASSCNCGIEDARLFANKKWSVANYGCLSLSEICSLSNEQTEQLNVHEKNIVQTFCPKINYEENTSVTPTPTSDQTLAPLAPTSTTVPTLSASSTPQPSFTPKETPSPAPTILRQPTLTPSESNVTETTQTYEITNSPNQITFIINLATSSASFATSSLQAEFTDPRGRIISIANHLDPGIYFVVDRTYQLLRLNPPANIEGTWALRIRAPRGMEYQVQTMQF